MTANRWIENSRRAFAALLSLYPKEHRNEYASAMQQVFTDQCRSAYQQSGAFGIVRLWLRTLADVSYSALLEHVTSPRAAWGLMEPVPNAPLPWKGVFLVLLPGLVYLVSQIAQLTGQPWYITVYYRAAFLLIIPVLVVWALTRRFPIWGLIPLGLLYRLVQEIGYQLILWHPGVFSSNPVLNAVLAAAKLVQKELLIPVVLFVVAIVLLAWRYARQQKPPRSFWIWTGTFLVLASIQIENKIAWITQYIHENAAYLMWSGQWPRIVVHDAITRDLYDFSALLLLIFIGTLFTQRHGFFAILLPIGYILPTILVGPQDANSPAGALVFISIAVLTFRVLLSLVAPIWMSRTESQAGKRRVVLISIAFALSIHVVARFYQLYLYDYPVAVMTNEFRDIALAELTTINAMILAVAMYQNSRPAADTPADPVRDYPELQSEKV